MSISVIIYWSTNPSVKKGTEVLQVFLESWFVKSKLTIHFFQHFLNYMQQTQLFHIRKLIRKEQSQCWEHYFPNSCKPRWMPEDRKRIIGKLNYFVKLLRVSWVFYSLFFHFHTFSFGCLTFLRASFDGFNLSASSKVSTNYRKSVRSQVQILFVPWPKNCLFYVALLHWNL